MNPFDILIITVLAYGLIRGVFRGLVRELASIIGVLGGFFAAYTYYPLVARMISPWIANPAYLNILSCLVVFSAVVIVVGMLAVIIKYLLNIAFLGWVDRVCGALFGMLKGFLVICVIFIVLAAFLPKGTPFLKKAAFTPYVATAADIMAKVLSEEMKDQFVSKSKGLKKF